MPSPRDFTISVPIIERDIGRNGFFHLYGSELRYIDELSAAEVGLPVDLKPLGYTAAAGFDRPRTRMIRYSGHSLAIAGLSGSVALVRVPLWAVGETKLPVIPAPGFKIAVS